MSLLAACVCHCACVSMCEWNHKQHHSGPLSCERAHIANGVRVHSEREASGRVPKDRTSCHLSPYSPVSFHINNISSPARCLHNLTSPLPFTPRIRTSFRGHRTAAQKLALWLRRLLFGRAAPLGCIKKIMKTNSQARSGTARPGCHKRRGAGGGSVNV